MSTQVVYLQREARPLSLFHKLLVILCQEFVKYRGRKVNTQGQTDKGGKYSKASSVSRKTRVGSNSGVRPINFVGAGQGKRRDGLMLDSVTKLGRQRRLTSSNFVVQSLISGLE